MVSQLKNLTRWLFQIPSPISGGVTFNLNLLILHQRDAQSTPALQTLHSMWRRAAPCITEPTTLVLWRSSMANLSAHCLATRPTWVWWLSRLPRWVAMFTALRSRSGWYMLSLDYHQPLQAGGRGEEEDFLQPGEGEDRREERNKSRTRTGSGLSLHVDLVYDCCTILDQYILYLAFILFTPYHSICSQKDFRINDPFAIHFGLEGLSYLYHAI